MNIREKYHKPKIIMKRTVIYPNISQIILCDMKMIVCSLANEYPSHKISIVYHPLAYIFVSLTSSSEKFMATDIVTNWADEKIMHVLYFTEHVSVTFALQKRHDISIETHSVIAKL